MRDLKPAPRSRKDESVYVTAFDALDSLKQAEPEAEPEPDLEPLPILLE